MKKESYQVKYPRRVFIRRSMTTLGKVLLALLADVEINGRSRLPKKGPIILAGNHVAVLEAVMMAVYTPGIVEFIGNGDIPFDPNYAFIANTYDLIPVNRGNLDRNSLNKAQDVLDQNGILGIFPEGGTWDPAQMQAQIGVAWLSFRANAPILPIGFGGIAGGLKNALQLKHPKLVMNVGELISPVEVTDESVSLKANLAASAEKILKKIKALVPEEDLKQFHRRINEKYHLEVEVYKQKSIVDLPKELRVKHGSAFAHFLYTPTMMDVLVRNISLPIKPIRDVYHQKNLTGFINALDSIIGYLKSNPGYFTYRFGVEDGLAVKEALTELRRLAEWADQKDYALTVNPIHSYQNANTGAQVIERGGCFPESM